MGCLMSWRSVIMMALAATIAGCSSSSGGSSSDRPSGPSADTSAKLACAHFRVAVQDEQSGTMTDQEFRDRLKDVYETGRVSATPGVAEGTRRVLAAVTAGDTTALQAGLTSLDSACGRVGQ